MQTRTSNVKVLSRFTFLYPCMSSIESSQTREENLIENHESCFHFYAPSLLYPFDGFIFLYVLSGSLLKLRGFIFLVEDSRMTFFYDPACKLNHHKSNRKLKVKPSYVIYELNPHYSNITYAKCCKWETFSVRFVQVD